MLGTNEYELMQARPPAPRHLCLIQDTCLVSHHYHGNADSDQQVDDESGFEETRRPSPEQSKKDQLEGNQEHPPETQSTHSNNDRNNSSNTERYLTQQPRFSAPTGSDSSVPRSMRRCLPEHSQTPTGKDKRHAFDVGSD